jgi:DNA-directed RNA polymerase specialized sigma24 family protein
MADVNVMVQRWQAGEERAAELLYNRFRERTFRLAYGLLGDAIEAEEAAQDALTYALLNINRYDAKRASFGTWLHTITVSRCRDRYRRRRMSTFSLQSWRGRGGTWRTQRPDRNVWLFSLKHAATSGRPSTT